MAPSRKRKSDEMTEPTTPEASGTPAPKKLRITQTQKQALIDNLQLEIAERARHLRAHYALQCADLRSRIDRRVNRIPVAMRSMTMSELMAKHDPPPAVPTKPITVTKSQPTTTAPTRTTRKQKSSIIIATDPISESANENEDNTTIKTRPPPLPKARTAKHPSRKTTKTGGAGVLSPRSHNSRTLPRSPIKPTSNAPPTTSTAECQPTSPSKPTHFSRPFSPLKPASPLKSAATAATSAITSSMHTMLSKSRTKTQPKPASPERTFSQASNHSAVSTATATSTGTVVKNAARAVRAKAGAAAKKATGKTAEKTAKTRAPATATAKGKTTTAAAAKKTVATVEAPVRRTLRKRN